MSKLQASIEYSIDDLQEIVDTFKRLHEENPTTTVPVIRLVKVEGRAKPEAYLLTSCSIQENIEG